MTTTFTLRGRLALTVVALIALISVGVAVAAVASARLYNEQQHVVVDLFEAYSAAADLNQAVVDQETAFRGFALTRDEEFLEPYGQAQQLADSAVERLDDMDEAFPELRPGRAEVQRRLAAWRTSAVEPGVVALRSGSVISAADLRADQDRFDSVREAIRSYRAAILETRDAQVQNLKWDAVVLFVVLGVALLLLLAAAVLTWVALQRWVTRPLARLGAEVDRVEGGDMARRVQISGAPQEIVALADQVDGMRVRILQEYALAEQSRTEATEARRQVEEQAEDLRRSNAELEQFAYVASHDLQEPLRKVASFCQLIERRYKGQLDERGEQYIEFAVDGAKRMQQLINDLLTFSRVGRSTGELGPVDLEQVLWQALRQLEVTLSDTGAVVTHDRLPTVVGDQSLLVQLLQNLIGNGVKFRAEEAPRVHIGVQRAPDAGMWEFHCSDNGIGIEPQYEDKIFVIFQRLHGRDVYGGTGIGLAMCKKIVEHHGGRIWLDTDASSPGTTFRWTLPVSQPGGAPDLTQPPTVAVRPAGSDLADQDEQALDAATPADTQTRTEVASDDTGDRPGAGRRDLARGGRPG